MEYLHFRHNAQLRKHFYRALVSDLHLDGPDFDNASFRLDFERISSYHPEECQAHINGDTLSLIMTGDRKRHTNSSTPNDRDEWIDYAKELAIKKLSPYADYIDMIGLGNHETSCIRFNHTDPIRDIIKELNHKRSDTLPEIVHGGYEGIIHETFQAREKGGSYTVSIGYNHGQGGTSEVTKGAIDLDRYSRSFDTDIIWLGHKHTRVIMDLEPIISVSSARKIVVRPRRGIITGCYSKVLEQSNTHKNGYKINYGAERMRGRQAQRGVMLHYTVQHDCVNIEVIS